MKIYRIKESKTSQLKKLLNNGNITEEQFKIADEFFKKHNAFENEIDWNKGNKITWEDLSEVIYKDRSSKSQTKKKIRKGLEGFEEGKDYLVLKETNSYVAYQPFTWEASRMIASHYVEPSENNEGEIEDAGWCTAYQKDSYYWEEHNKTEAFIYICGETIPSKKVAISISKEERDASDSKFLYNTYTEDYDLNFNIWDFGDYNYTIEIKDLLKVVPDLNKLIYKAYKNWQKLRIDKIKSKFIFNPETNKYDYPESLFEGTLEWFIKDNKDGFIINFGKISGSFQCAGLGLTSLKGAPEEVKYHFDCSHNNLTSLEGAPQKVWGSFFCDDNPYLTSLKGAPVAVGSNFNCSYTNLTSLEGAPQLIGGEFRCNASHLTSLKGAPERVGGSFICMMNQMPTLEGSPKFVGGNFLCHDSGLISLKGAPRKVLRDFYCVDNQLTSLEGAPEEVGGDFTCSNNHLTSLKGAPEVIKGNFDCSNNQLTSLEGAPKFVEGAFTCYENKLTTLKGAPKKVGGSFRCRRNPDLHSLEGIGEVGRSIFKDF